MNSVAGGSGKYIEFGSNGTERTTIIADIFNIIQTVRDTGIHLKGDEEEEWNITQGKVRGKQVGIGPTCVDSRMHSAYCPCS